MKTEDSNLMQQYRLALQDKFLKSGVKLVGKLVVLFVRGIASSVPRPTQPGHPSAGRQNEYWR